MFAVAQNGKAQACPPQYVIVDALDAKGIPITDLAAENFKALHRGQALNIVSASFRQDPSTRTIVLLDTSTTMGGFGAQGINKWRIAWSAASEFISTAPPQASVSLFTFSEAIGHMFKNSDGRQAMKDWLNSREAMGTTFLKGTKALYRTLPDVLKEMTPPLPGDAIYLVTDGREFTDGATVARAAGELQSRGVRLFGFVLDDVTQAMPRAGLGAGEVSDLIQDSGGLGVTWSPGGRLNIGTTFSPKSFEYDDTTLRGIRATDYRIEAAITNFYVLGVVPSASASAAEDWKLEVVDGQGKKRNDVFLAYPGKLQGCAGKTIGQSVGEYRLFCGGGF
jgi:hypothetical protein